MSTATKIRKMIEGLEEIEAEYQAKNDRHAFDGYLREIKDAKQALERLWKDSTG